MNNCLVAVDIRSTHNVGAFFRTCDGLGADLILVGITPRPIGDKKDERLPHIAKRAHNAISKTALGSEESVSWRYFDNVNTALDKIKAEGYSVCAIEQHKSSKPLSQLIPDNNKSPLALLVGPEVEGLPVPVLEKCDYIYEIPMKGQKESFNVSIAAAIALYTASE